MIRVQARAKINFFLEVMAKRPDGYHDLRSLLAPISLSDEMEFEVLPDGSVETEMDVRELPEIVGVSVAGSDDNLTTRAARLLQQETGCRKGVRIRIRKGIPIGGGLGGGSSDAAATLRTLNRIWELNLPPARLISLAARLGSDIPALVQGGMVAIEGVGDRVAPLDRAPGDTQEPWWLVVVNPGFSTSTRDIYERYRTRLTSDPESYNNMRSALLTGNVRLAAKHLFNSLEATVFCKYPLARMLVERLREAGALGAMVSGSGSSIFALAGDEGHARELERTLRSRADGAIWSRVARTMPDSVMVAHDPLEVRV
jgi:4-diphosphocytidyl-2-C-methyl-D-erythritol kinase